MVFDEPATHNDHPSVGCFHGHAVQSSEICKRVSSLWSYVPLKQSQYGGLEPSLLGGVMLTLYDVQNKAWVAIRMKEQHVSQ